MASAGQFIFTYTNNVTATSIIPAMPTQPLYYTGTARMSFVRQRPRKVHLRVKTGEVQGFPTMWAACNIRSRPDWFQKDYPVMTEDPDYVTCGNCLRRMRASG